MLPKGIKIVSLSVKEETIRKRKQDTLHDPHLDRKIKAYDIIAREFNLTVIDNNRTFNEALENILRVFKVNEGIKE
jgi:hypothetical protein